VYQYLLAWILGQYVDSRRISFRVNREEAIRRGIDKAELKGDSANNRVLSSKEEVDRFLANDPGYKLNIMLNNMREVLIELYSFLLFRAYGSLEAQTARNLLTLTDITKFFETGCNPQQAPEGRQEGNGVFGPAFEFLRYCAKQYYFENRAEIEASPRLKSYLAHKKVVNAMRASLLHEDERIVDYSPVWKRPGYTFIKSLPALRTN
jgi:hypothetical protein